MKKLSQKRKGEIARALLSVLPRPTMREMLAVAQKNGMPFSEVVELMKKPHGPVKKLKRAS